MTKYFQQYKLLAKSNNPDWAVGQNRNLADMKDQFVKAKKREFVTKRLTAAGEQVGIAKLLKCSFTDCNFQGAPHELREHINTHTISQLSQAQNPPSRDNSESQQYIFC